MHLDAHLEEFIVQDHGRGNSKLYFSREALILARIRHVFLTEILTFLLAFPAMARGTTVSVVPFPVCALADGTKKDINAVERKKGGEGEGEERTSLETVS